MPGTFGVRVTRGARCIPAARDAFSSFQLDRKVQHAPVLLRRFQRGHSLATALPALPSRVNETALETGGFDVVGLGQAMVDFSGVVPTSYLRAQGLEAGGRRCGVASSVDNSLWFSVIDVDERAAILDELNNSEFKLHTGGALANTLSGLAMLGGAAAAAAGAIAKLDAPFRVGMAGCIGDDHLGHFFRTNMREAGVDWFSRPEPSSGTGTVIVLTTPDAQRSFLSYPGSSASLGMCPRAADAILRCRLLVVEGYLWEFPDASTFIQDAVALAREGGAVVAMTVADVSVVQRHKDAMIGAMSKADIVFTNEAEAYELTRAIPNRIAVPREKDQFRAESSALQLGALCPMAVVTDGSRGSCVAAMGQLHVVPPVWSRSAPVDTCGAGDAYAAGFLHGFLTGMSVHEMGEFAAATASKVIQRVGSHLSHVEALELVASRPSTALTRSLSAHCEAAVGL